MLAMLASLSLKLLFNTNANPSIETPDISISFRGSINVSVFPTPLIVPSPLMVSFVVLTTSVQLGNRYVPSGTYIVSPEANALTEPEPDSF